LGLYKRPERVRDLDHDSATTVSQIQEYKGGLT